MPGAGRFGGGMSIRRIEQTAAPVEVRRTRSRRSLPMRGRIAALKLVAVAQADVGAHAGEQQGEFAGIECAVQEREAGDIDLDQVRKTRASRVEGVLAARVGGKHAPAAIAPEALFGACRVSGPIP